MHFSMPLSDSAKILDNIDEVKSWELHHPSSYVGNCLILASDRAAL